MVKCPTCGRESSGLLAERRVRQCDSAHRHRQLSVKVGTIFEDSPLGLEKWLPAARMILWGHNSDRTGERVWYNAYPLGWMALAMLATFFAITSLWAMILLLSIQATSYHNSSRVVRCF